MDLHAAGDGVGSGAATLGTGQQPITGHFARMSHDLLTVKLLSLCVGAASLAATIIASYFFLRMRRSFRHDLVVLLLFGDFIKGICFVAYPIAALVSADGPGAPLPADSTFCRLNGFMLAVGTEASDVAVLLIALHTVLYIVRPLPRRRGGGRGLYPFRHWAVAAWILYPIVNASIAFAGRGGPAYEDTGEFCYLTVREDWYRLYLAWTPRYVIFGLIVVLDLGLFTFVRFSQWKYDRECVSRWDRDAAAAGVVPPTPPIQRHGLIPDDDTPTIMSRGPTTEDELSWPKSRQDSGAPLIKQAVLAVSSEQNVSAKSPRASISSADLEPPRPGECRRVSFTKAALEKDAENTAPSTPGGGLVDYGKWRDRGQPQRIDWNWGGMSVPGSSGGGGGVARPSFPPRRDRLSESPMSSNFRELPSPFATESSTFIEPTLPSSSRPRPSIDGPGISPRTSVDRAKNRQQPQQPQLQPGKNLQHMQHTEAHGRKSIPITAPPLPMLATSSAHKDLIAVLRAGPPSRPSEVIRSLSIVSTTTAGGRRPSTPSIMMDDRDNTTAATAKKPLVRFGFRIFNSRKREQPSGIRSQDGSQATASTAIADEGVAAMTATRRIAQARVRRRLRLLCVYPLIYIGMWLVPFVSHVMCYDGELEQRAASEPFWVLALSVTSLAVQGAINAALFSWRERPWRHRDPRSLWSRLRSRAVADWERARCQCAMLARWTLTFCSRCAGTRKGQAEFEAGRGEAADAGEAGGSLSGREACSVAAGSGRSKPEMVDDGRLARQRRQNEMRGEVERAAERARRARQRYWWDVEADLGDLSSDDELSSEQPGAASGEFAATEVGEVELRVP